MVFGTSNVAIEPAGSITIELRAPQRSVTNTVATPAVQPVMTSPPGDTLYSRSDSILIAWETIPGDTDSVSIEMVMPSFYTTGREWYRTAAGSDGQYYVTPDAWVGLSDTLATFYVFRYVTRAGEGLGSGMIMRTGLGAGRQVRISAPESS